MKKSLIAVLKYLLGLGFGFGLLYFAFRGVDMESLIAEVNKAKFSWLFAAISVGLLSHYLRAIRWRMQFQASGYDPATTRTFAAVMIMYLVNLAIPRAGEFARCSALLRSDKIPISTSLGTVVVERVFDLLILGILAVVVFLLEYDSLYRGLRLFSAASMETVQEPAGMPVWFYALLAVFGLGVVAAWVFRKRIMQLALYKKVINFGRELFHAALSIRYLKHPGWFLILTVLIWVCYAMMTYLGFFAMPSISELDLNLPYFALVITVIGGIGFALPSPGGVGSYHAAVVITFLAFGVLPDEVATKELGGAFAAIIHAAQILLMIIFGALAYFYLWMQPRRNSRIVKDEESFLKA